MQQAFDKMSLLMAADALAAYLDHNKWFDVNTDASDFQLGACIIQEGRLIAYFSQKLMKSQQNYTTMEKEMLSIIATLGEFQSMLLGANIHVFTYHKNLTFDTLKTQRVLRWQTKPKSFHPCYTILRAPQHSIQKPFKTPLPSHTSSDCGGEETHRACRGFYQGRRQSLFLGSRILGSLQ
jgi:hypothetical protein